MTTDPAVTAAAEAIHRARCCDNGHPIAWRFYIDHAVAAVAAARPIVEAEVRERIATEVEAIERLGGMVEWLAEVIVDAREACAKAEGIEPMGSPEWVESGIAMRTTVLREIRLVLDRERNADPSRYDVAIRERDEARAATARVRGVPGRKWDEDGHWLLAADVFAALDGAP